MKHFDLRDFSTNCSGLAKGSRPKKITFLADMSAMALSHPPPPADIPAKNVLSFFGTAPLRDEVTLKIIFKVLKNSEYFTVYFYCYCGQRVEQPPLTLVCKNVHIK